MLHISEDEMRDAARRHASTRSVIGLLLRQGFHEARLRSLKGIEFRVRRNEAACRAYCAMGTGEFEGVNARQEWANWRTIPRNLNGRAPARPVWAIDLCCGTGRSTAVLAYYLAPGSRILGLEYNQRFVELASSRRYGTRWGGAAWTSFNAQSVLEPFRDVKGRLVDDRSIDIVNSSGAVGCHFDASATAVLAREVGRVLRPGGLALIDSGPDGTSPRDLLAIFRHEGFEPVHRARSCMFDRYVQVCFRKGPC